MRNRRLPRFGRASAWPGGPAVASLPHPAPARRPWRRQVALGGPGGWVTTRQGRALQLVQAQAAALQVVLDAAGRADHDVQAAPQRTLLRPVRAAAVQAGGRQRCRLPDVLKVRVHLRGGARAVGARGAGAAVLTHAAGRPTRSNGYSVCRRDACCRHVATHAALAAMTRSYYMRPVNI